MRHANQAPLSRLFKTVLFVVLAMAATPSFATDTTLSDTPETLFNSADAQGLRDKATALATPARIYEYVRNDFEHALYHGARSNAVNTFLGQRGNDLDLSSILIAMYRYKGIPARYVVGKVQVKAADIQNWLGVHNLDLAVGILNDQGIQGVILAPDRSYVEFEHVWTEVSVPFGDYRGAGPGATSVNCATTPSRCSWIALDPSFKLKRYPTAPIDIHDTVNFDYTAYYNAIKNNDESRKENNPLQIHETAILDYLRANQPGKGLADVADVGEILTEEAGILPASLPYQTTGSLRRYNSVTDHDTAENPDWRKYVTVTVNLNGRTLTGVKVSEADLSTQRLTFAYEKTPSPAQVLRLNGVELLRVALNGSELDGAGQPVQLGSQFELLLDMDGRAMTDGSGQTDHHLKSYTGQTMGGMQLIGAGGEASNWGSVHLAASQLLTANQQYAIAYLYDSANQTYVPYVDANRNGTVDAGEIKLIDHDQAMQALTGGLLEVAMREYLVRVRESVQRIDALGHTISPIEGFAGITSSTYEADYYGDIPFSILPGGLLIDVKGLEILGSWRTNAAQQASDKQFLLIGHMSSALEHEVWQDLTGFDAISTVRGIQMAMANGAALVNPKKNTTTDTLPGLYTQFGYQSAPQTPFAFRSSTIFSSTPASWYLNPNDGVVRGFGILKKQVGSTTPTYRYGPVNVYSNDGWDSFVSNVDTLENNLNAGITQYGSGCTVSSPGYYFGGQYHAGSCSTVLNALSAYWAASTSDDVSKFLDQNQGFVNSEHVYRNSTQSADALDVYTLQRVRNELYTQNPSQFWAEFLLPNKQAYGPYYRFSVFIEQWHNVSDNALYGMLFGIQNNSFLAGGGYVDVGTIVTPSTPLSEGAAITPAYTNALFTSKHLIAQVNNDPLKTPSTVDPISTVTGNNYHDETDFSIKSRGLNYAFTRTYNSGQQATTLDGILGVGWRHSYGMKLKANDWGDCPDCAAGTGAGKRPENGNGVTASITYIDERGGEHLYLVNETSKAVTAPQGEFNSLSFDSPAAGYHTLTFRNGVKYVFQTVGSGILKNAPGVSARLARIEDPYGNVLNLTYNASGQLTQVRDNLNIATRTGLALAYFTNGRLKSVTDWSGRQWQYSYDSDGNLDFALNPLSQKINYSYQEGGTGNGPHDLTEVTLPELRNGQPVKTAFQYYRNGRAFSQKNALDQGETLQYDLYRRSTRVTDARGAVRIHGYNANGALTRLEEPDGGVLLFANQNDGLRYQKYDALGYATNYSYRSDRSFGSASDNGGNVSRERDALNYDSDSDYGIYDQVSAVKDKNGHNRRYVYATTTNATACGGDIKGKLKETRADLNGQLDVLLAQHYYDPYGNPCVTRELIEAGNTSRFRQTDWYFDAENLYLDHKVVHQSNDLTRPYLYIDYSYDSLGRLLAQILYVPDPNDSSLLFQTTSYQYDALDRVTKVTNPRGDIRETVYDANGQIAQEKVWHKQPNNLYTVRTVASHQYDAADRRIATTDVLGKTTQFAYDAAGNLTKVTDANGHTTQYEYDAMNRKTAVIDGNGRRTDIKYNLRGEAIAVTNTNGETVKSEYDAIGPLTKVIDPLGHETRFQYDANGNQTCIIDANALSNAGDPGHQPVNTDGCTESRQYDELNRLKQSKDAQGNLTAYSYDLFGNRLTVTDAENHITTFRYDDMGRMTEIVDPLIETPTDLTQTFAYDQAGNVIEATDRKGQISHYRYDRLNRITQIDHLADNSQETYTYDLFSDLIQSQNADITYTYTYDAKHQLKSKTDSRASKTLSWNYDPVGNIDTKTDYQGDVTDYQYDNANRLVAETNPAYLQVSYHYDGAGRLLDRILSNGAQTRYGWDAAGRLTQLKNTTLTGQLVNDTSYTRDRLGNILTQIDHNASGQVTGTTTFSYDPEYRLLSADYPGTANDESFSYDKVGNRKTYTKAGSTKYYNVDAGNRLKDIRTSSPTGSVYESYQYDDNGSLTNVSGNRSMTLTWDANNRVKQIGTTAYQYDPSGYRIQKAASLTNRYYLEGEHLEAIYDGNGALRDQYLRGTVIDEVVNGYHRDANNVMVNSTYHHDALQSVLGQSAHDGQIQATQSYTAFGGNLSGTGTSNTAQMYTGRESDGESGFYYYRARYYDPATGRFISEDPKGFGAGVNFYAYVNNNPVNANDPTGEIPLPLITGAFGAGAVAIGSAIGQVASNGGFDNFNFRNVGIAAGVGFVAGAAAPYTALTYAGAAVTNAVANVAQYGVTQVVNKQDITTQGILLNGVTGVLGGLVAGPVAQATGLTYAVNSPWLSSQLATQLNNNLSILANVSATGVIRGVAGATTSSIDVPSIYNSITSTFSSSSNFAANGGFVLYPNKSNTNMMTSVYSK
jgi:RHS repeat-associated protein